MTLNQIQCFLTAARVLNFTRTAELLYSTQQSVSNQIMQLEQELGCSLFDRKGRELSLTREGVFFNDFFYNKLREGKRLLADIKLDTAWRQRCLRIAYSVWISPFGEIDRGVSAFRHSHPDKVYYGCQYHNNQLVQLLRDDKLDVAVIPGGQDMMAADLEYIPFARQEISLCVPDSITADVPAEDCWGLPLLYTAAWNWSSFEDGRIIGQELSDLNLSPTKVRMMPNVQSICSQLEFGNCVAVVDKRFGIASDIRGTKYLPLVKGASECFCVRHVSCENPDVNRFIDYLRDFYSDEKSD